MCIRDSPKGIPIRYRAGDQPNNAMSLNVLNSGEIAATGGTSGVLYGLTDNLKSKEYLRINNFAHVNYSQTNKLIGKLLCLNGAGIQYKWIKNLTSNASYLEMNKKASNINICLLYTSPSPRDATLSRMPSSA